MIHSWKQFSKRCAKQFSVLLFASLLSGGATFARGADWTSVEKILGRPGTVRGNILKMTFPRSDLHVKVGEVQVQARLAHGLRAALDKTNSRK